MVNKDVEILEESFMLEILRFVDGKSSILAITKKVSMTYKTVFNKIKKLEKEKVIEIVNKFPKITEEYSVIVYTELIGYEKIGIKNIDDILEDKNQRDLLKKMMNIIKNNRLISRKKLYRKLKDSSPNFSPRFFVGVHSALMDSFLIRERIEITKQGRYFMENLE